MDIKPATTAFIFSKSTLKSCAMLNICRNEKNEAVSVPYPNNDYGVSSQC